MTITNSSPATLASTRPDLGIGRRFDGFHVFIGKAEMVADLVHQHMGDDLAQRLAVLALAQ